MYVFAVDALTKRYRNGTLANDAISLNVSQGEVFGLLGPNGAGKTTLVRQVLGLLRPTSGTITLNGTDVVADPGYARRNIGFLPQGTFDMEGAHVDEVICSVAKLRGLRSPEAKRRTEELIERLDLGPFRKTPMRAASGGVKRLTGFAAAVIGRQSILVLDEPTNDIDPVRRQLLWSMLGELREAGTTVLLVTHNLAEAERVIDRLAIIDHGRILRQGAPAELRTLVSDRLRLEVTAAAGFTPLCTLTPDPAAPGAFLFAYEALSTVSGWLQAEREYGRILDFRIGPPTLDDIYTATVGNGKPALAEAS